MKIYLTLIATTVFTSVWSLDSYCLAQDSKEKSGQNATAVSDWLEGSGETLRMRVRGKILDQSGAPATKCQIKVELESAYGGQSLNPILDGHEFEFWTPVNTTSWSYIVIEAVSAKGDRRAYKELGKYELRDAAMNGLSLTLRQITRTVEVSVVDEGRPVPGAQVQLTLLAGRRIAKTDESGNAHFDLLPEQKLKALTAWTYDFKTGGYLIYGDLKRDPDSNRHTIELADCQTQKIRFVDEAKTPVANLNFVITVRTQGSDTYWTGITENAFLKTDENGEAIYKWFPDWENADVRMEPTDAKWMQAAEPEIVGDSILSRVRQRQFQTRKAVTGKLESKDTNVAGFLVTLQSFQGEEENTMDWLTAFADQSGEFTFEVLPDATYCASLNDRLWVSELVDLIPFESSSGKVSSPKLTITKGEQVEIVVTCGPEKDPIAYQGLSLETPHDFTWREPGRTESGQASRRWWLITDENGKATTYALPGKLIGSIYTNTWRSNKEIDVSPGAHLEFHRTSANDRNVQGRLILPKELETSLAGAEISIGSIDGETSDRKSLSANEDGTFSFQTKAAQVGVFASTRDSKAAGFAIVDNVDLPIELTMAPTLEYQGRLLGLNDKPLVGHSVRAVVRIPEREDRGGAFPRSFDAKTIEAKTDEDGNYLLHGMPTGITINIRADAIDNSNSSTYIDRVYLTLEETRGRSVSHLAKAGSPASTKTWSERFNTVQRDCLLSGFHLMVIMKSSDEVDSFLDSNFLDYGKMSEVGSYIQLQFDAGVNSPRLADIEFAKQNHFPIPEKNQVFACVFDANGRELERIEISVDNQKAEDMAAEFIRGNAPKQIDARLKWDEAFAEAKRSNRKVWARVSQRYCNPCFLLARWLDDQKQILDKDFVMLKVDDVRDLNGIEIAEKVTQGKQLGIPFCAILDQDGKLIIDSDSPVGNFGHPSGYEGKKHLRKMLMDTRTRLTDEEIDQIVNSLED